MMHRASMAYQSAEGENAGALIQRYRHIIDRTARRIAARAPGCIEAEELWSAGALGLLDAAARFEKDRAVKFETFVEHRVRGAMLDELRRLDRLPRRMRTDADKIKTARKKLSASLGRDPTMEELAQAAEMDIEKIEAIEQIQEPELPLLPEMDLVDEALSAETLVARGELSERLRDAIASLGERQSLVLSLHYVEGLTYKEISKMLEVSEARICQIHKEALERLKVLLRQRGAEIP